jgi:hypothetical protein
VIQGLTDVTNKPSKVKPSDAESYDVIQAVKRKIPSQSWDRIVETVDEAIESSIQDSGKLTWTKTGVLFGHGSLQPKRHVDHLWDNVIKAVGDDKNCLMAVGGLLRWRISVRKETWLVYRRETGDVDPISGKNITVSEYWINQSYVPPVQASVADLAKAWRSCG